MSDIWQNYTEFKTNNDLSASYYAFIATCFKEGIKAVACSKPFENALDIACGAAAILIMVI